MQVFNLANSLIITPPHLHTTYINIHLCAYSNFLCFENQQNSHNLHMQ